MENRESYRQQQESELEVIQVSRKSKELSSFNGYDVPNIFMRKLATVL